MDPMRGVWQEFWRDYYSHDVKDEQDLFRQVAQTLQKQPIPAQQFARKVTNIREILKLSAEDHLLDLCCGNGLFDYELAPEVHRVTAVDFTEHLVMIARERKSRPNIAYFCGDATAPLEGFIHGDRVPNKVLMNESLAYFGPDDLNSILKNILNLVKSRPVRVLFSGVPDYDLRWKFYNTPDRVARYEANEKQQLNTNDGVGRWWHRDEIREIAKRQGLAVQIEAQPQTISNYRMDVVIDTTEIKSKDRVYLRALELGDKVRTYTWHNDPELYASLGRPFRYVSKHLEEQWLEGRIERNDEVNLAICVAVSDEHIGNIYLRDIDWIARRGELHIFIGTQAHRGKGYGACAIRQLLRHAFRDLGLRRVFLRVLEDNTLAICLYEKCGFVQEGRLRRHSLKQGTIKDVIGMGLLADEYAD